MPPVLRVLFRCKTHHPDLEIEAEAFQNFHCYIDRVALVPPTQDPVLYLVPDIPSTFVVSFRMAEWAEVVVAQKAGLETDHCLD